MKRVVKKARATCSSFSSLYSNFFYELEKPQQTAGDGIKHSFNFKYALDLHGVYHPHILQHPAIANEFSLLQSSEVGVILAW